MSLKPLGNRNWHAIQSWRATAGFGWRVHRYIHDHYSASVVVWRFLWYALMIQDTYCLNHDFIWEFSNQQTNRSRTTHLAYLGLCQRSLGLPYHPGRCTLVALSIPLLLQDCSNLSGLWRTCAGQRTRVPQYTDGISLCRTDGI